MSGKHKEARAGQAGEEAGEVAAGSSLVLDCGSRGLRSHWVVEKWV